MSTLVFTWRTQPRKPEDDSTWFLGYPAGMYAQTVDMRHKGPYPMAVVFNVHDGHPSRWHLEGPISVKESTSNIAVYLRRATYYLLAWEGRATKRNLNTLVSELMYNDISMLQRYEVVRSRSVPLLHFLPTSFEFAITISPLVR